MNFRTNAGLSPKQRFSVLEFSYRATSQVGLVSRSNSCLSGDHLSSKTHKVWAMLTITLPQPLPSSCSHQEREKPCVLLTYVSLLHRASRKTKQLNWLTNVRCAHALSQEYRPGEGWLHPVLFPPGATALYIPYHSLTICLFRVDNRILSQKHTALFRPCLAASVKHWGSSLNECIWASHKFLEEKVMQIFHLHSSRLWPRGNLCGCVVSAKGFQVLSDLACEINSHVKGIGFVQKHCWKAAQWFLWLNRREVLLYSYSWPAGEFQSSSSFSTA